MRLCPMMSRSRRSFAALPAPGRVWSCRATRAIDVARRRQLRVTARGPGRRGRGPVRRGAAGALDDGRRSWRGSGGGPRRRRCSTGGRRTSPTAGSEIIARVGEFPDFPEEPSRAELDRELSAQASGARGRRGYRGGLPRPASSFLGTPKRRPGRRRAGEHVEPRAGESSLPPLEADLIEIQVDAAIRKKQVLFSVEELEGDSPGHGGHPHRAGHGRRAGGRGHLGDDPAGRPALPRPLAPGLPAGRGPGAWAGSRWPSR